MKKEWLVKTLALGVIVLLISVSIQPVFANEPTEKVTDSKTVDDEKIEYTIQIIKTNKVIENKVYLTQQQADELENLIENIGADLNNSETQEETKEIYNNAVNSFNNLGLFPENISINEIKQLVTGENRNLDKIKFKKETSNGFENRFCFVACDTTYTGSFGPIILLPILTFIPLFAYSIFLEFLRSINLSKFKTLYSLFMIPYYLLLILFLSLAYCSAICITSEQPISIGSLITFGSSGFYDDKPSNGWIFTLGLNGIKSYNGDFYGQLFGIFLLAGMVYTGIIGFTGISIRKSNIISAFRLGFGLHVNISSGLP